MIRMWAAVLVLSAIPAHAAGLDELAWMTGAWSETKGDTVTQEQWLDGRAVATQITIGTILAMVTIPAWLAAPL